MFVILSLFFMGSFLITPIRSDIKHKNGLIFTQIWNITVGGSSSEEAYSIFVSGSTIYFSGYTYSYGVGISNQDVYVVKMDNNALGWNKTWGGGASDSAYGIAVYGNNIYLCGYTYSYGEGSSDILVIKYDSNGKKMWNITWGTNETDRGTDVAIDKNGNIYVVGYGLAYTSEKYDVVLQKYSSDGTLVWTKYWGGTDDDISKSIFIDNEGYIYVTGYTGSYGAGLYDAFILKYDASGELLWNKTWGYSGYDHGEDIAVDGDIYVVGSTINSAGEVSVVVIKYDKDGNQMWNTSWGGMYSDYGYGLCVSGDSLYVTGKTASYGAGKNDIFLLKCSKEGNILGYTTWGGSEDDIGYDVVVDSGYICVVGSTNSYGNSAKDIVIIKYSESAEGTGGGASETISSTGWEQIVSGESLILIAVSIIVLGVVVVFIIMLKRKS